MLFAPNLINRIFVQLLDGLDLSCSLSYF